MSFSLFDIVKKKLQNSAEQGQAALQSLSKPSDGIRVVTKRRSSSGQPQYSQAVERHLAILSEIPRFEPILKDSISVFGSDSQDDLLARIDHRPMCSIVCRLEGHLKICADAIAFDQQSLHDRIKEVDIQMSSLHVTIAEKHRKLSKWTESLSQLDDIYRTTIQVTSSLSHTVKQIEELNRFLPADLQLPALELPDDFTFPSNANNS